MLTDAIRSGKQPPERKLTIPESMPSLVELAARAARAEDFELHHSAGR
jgi:hypothetical protein